MILTKPDGTPVSQRVQLIASGAVPMRSSVRRKYLAKFIAAGELIAQDIGPDNPRPKQSTRRRGMPRSRNGHAPVPTWSPRGILQAVVTSRERGRRGLVSLEEAQHRFAMCDGCPLRVGHRCGAISCPNKSDLRVNLRYEQSECPHGRWQKPFQPWQLIPQPFIAQPRKLIAFHVYPHRGARANWLWHLEQIGDQLDKFERCRIAIVTDRHTVRAEEVQSILGDRAEYLVRRNHKMGESLTFRDLLAPYVADADPNSAIWYGHAKGIKAHVRGKPAVRKWCEAMYEATLRNWDQVRGLMEEGYPIAGCLKAQHWGTPFIQTQWSWHYSGTFFWVRPHMIPADWQARVRQTYGGVEVWPGDCFPSAAGAGIVLDDPPFAAAYKESFWRSRQSEYNQWLNTRS